MVANRFRCWHPNHSYLQNGS